MASGHSRSTGDLLSYMTDHVSLVLGKQSETRSVSLDISHSKAFDKVGHQGLLTKLHSYGVSDRLNKLVDTLPGNSKNWDILR